MSSYQDFQNRMNLFFDPANPSLSTQPIPVEYHLHVWSQNGPHHAELRTHAPLTIPAEIKGATFADFCAALFEAETHYGFQTTLTWG